MGAVNLVADFGIFPVGHNPGQSFYLGSFWFDDISHSGGSEIRAELGESGLRIPNQGIRIVLPVPSDLIEMRLGTFAGSISISGKDVGGHLVPAQSFYVPNQFFDVRFSAREISSISLIDGNNEALLVKISTLMSSCP